VPNDRPWQTKPTGPRAQRKPWVGKPSGNAPGGDRPWREKPAGGPPRGDRPRGAKPFGEQRPWTGKPPGPPRGDRPPDHRGSPDRRPDGGGWSSKPPGSGDRKPWQKAPFRPGGPPRQDARGGRPAPRKRRDDEPPDRDS
jgi:23S rRNA pseudouridine2605 synthase